MELFQEISINEITNVITQRFAKVDLFEIPNA